MNLDNLNKWLALSANLGVLVGIFFLSMQINQANRIANGTMEHDLRDRWSEISNLIIENPDFSITWAKLQSPNQELSVAEQQQVFNYARSYFLFFVSVEEAFENELLSDNALNRYMGILPDLLERNPGFAPFFRVFIEERNETGGSRMSRLVEQSLTKLGVQ